MKLHFKEFGEGQALLILHGLFGSSDNWQTLAKVLAKQYHVFIIDQRNHGHSEHSIEEFNYHAMSDDLHEFIEGNNLNNVILLGHSMGGKTIMQYAMDYGTDVIDKMIVADIGPKQYPLHHEAILKALTTTDFTVHTSRKLVDEHLAQFIEQIGVRQFLLKNLYWKNKGELAWRFNVDVLNRDIANVVAGLGNDLVDVNTLFIRGSMSNYILDQDIELIGEQFPNAKLETIDGVGHWLHAEAPEEFIQKVNAFIEN